MIPRHWNLIPGGWVVIDCTDSRTCPRVFETERGTVVVQGYQVDEATRPTLAQPPTGEDPGRAPARAAPGLRRRGGGEDAGPRPVRRLEAQPFPAGDAAGV